MIRLNVINCFFILTLLVACSSQTISDQDPDQEIILSLEQTAQAAQVAYATLNNISVDSVQILEAQEVVWSSGAVGCPRPGLSYTQALIEGYRILVSRGSDQAYYHSSRGQKPFLCPEERRSPPIEVGHSIY